MKGNNIIFSTLRAEMARGRVTIADLASASGTTRESMSSWLSGKRAISLKMAFIIQKEFFPHLTVKELFAELLHDSA